MRRLPTSALIVVCVTAFAAVAGATPMASAATPGPGWTIRSTAEPTNFSANDNASCEREKNGCDSYKVIVQNIGSASSSGTVTISDVLPEGLVVNSSEGIEGEEQQAGSEPSRMTCTTSPLTEPLECTYGSEVPPGGLLIVTILVSVGPDAPPVVENKAEIKGGVTPTAPSAATSEPASQTNTINGGPPPFAFTSFAFSLAGVDGAPDLQAGDHPYGVTVGLSLANAMQNNVNFERPFNERIPVQDGVKNLAVTLPAGMVGNPQATPRCPLNRLLAGVGYSGETGCPAASAVGSISFELTHSIVTSGVTGYFTSLVYNMEPEAGYPAEFGFTYAGKPAFIYAGVTPAPGDVGGYGLRAFIPGLLNIELRGASVTFFGNPAEHDGGTTSPQAFLTNPVDCAAPEPLQARIEGDSWEDPGRYVSAEAEVYPRVTGCNALQFNPVIAFAPEGAARADEPSGYGFGLRIPRATNVAPVPATPELKDATVMLPEGVSVSPSAADGLVGCQETGPEGIDIPHGEGRADEVGEGQALGPEGLSHLTSGHCPAGSTLGTVEFATPLLPEPLQGHIYLGTPACGHCTAKDAEEGRLIRLYIEAEGSGVVVKLPGTVSADPNTGQLTASFENNPQLPFEDLKLNFKSGPRAPLATPNTCGTYTTNTDLEPWSAPETPDATPSSSFNVSSGPNGGACAPTETAEPNQPTFEAGTLTPIAGSYSPFVLKLAREDGSQRIRSIDATLPKGLTGKLAGIPYCSEAQIAAAAANGGTAEKQSPSCPIASEVGTVNVGAGPGSHPFYVQGHAYLAGPYKGAPLSLAIVTPAVAGPFDLGTVVVRTALYVNETTAQIHAVSDPIPSILAGIPLDVRSIALNMDKPKFILNPTSCNAMAVLGGATTIPGQTANLSERFQVGACGALGFKPSVALTLKGATKRNQHPALKAVVTYPKKGAYANIAKAAVTLPASEFIDNARIGDVCTRPQFAAGKCPPSSVLGKARAFTPLLDKPLEGPVYFRSNGGERELPDLVADLGGQIHVVLVGAVDAVHKKGSEVSRVRNTFAQVPDAPVSKFVLELKGGKKGLLVNSGNLCKVPNKAVVKLTAQNGKTYDTQPAVANSCGKKGKRHK